MSFPAVLGVMSYCVTAVLNALASRRGGRQFWLWGVIFFGLMVFWRTAGAEDAIRDLLRARLGLHDLYHARRGLQTVLAIGVAVAGFAAGVAAWKRRAALGRHGRHRWLAETAMAGLVGLISIRLISLSSIDRVLYGGPIHLNWIIEGTLVGLCAFAAWREWRSHG